MAKIISLSAIREKRALYACIDQPNGFTCFGTHKPLGKSPSHRKSHLNQSVNPYKTIQILNRINFLLKQGISLLTEENRRLKGL